MDAKKSDSAHAQDFVIERRYAAPVEVVWQAITDPMAIKEWFMPFEGFAPQPGCKFQFTATDNDNVSWLHRCVVTEVVPQQKLAYTWSYDGQPGDTLVAMELFAEGEQTRLKLTHSGLDTLPALPAFARENFAAGWTELIGSLLKDYVERRTPQ